MFLVVMFSVCEFGRAAIVQKESHSHPFSLGAGTEVQVCCGHTVPTLMTVVGITSP